MQGVVVSSGNGASNASTVQAEPEVLDAKVEVYSDIRLLPAACVLYDFSVARHNECTNERTYRFMYATFVTHVYVYVYIHMTLHMHYMHTHMHVHTRACSKTQNSTKL